ncbi:MAG TPA: CDP-glucose 4,6-dehydratase [Syntrophorhabdaceae bacterium]|nr:CDP-glucose 4,6-dehydratase [Syntrophorhabdaceae bacterium]
MGGVVMNDHLSLFRGKKVIVTGDTGFKGSWLSLWLTMCGAEVLGYSLPPARDNDHYNLVGLSKIIRHIDGDVRDHGLMKKIFSDFDPEFIFHLAAQALVRYSYNEPKYTFDTNVGGFINVLEVARSLPELRSIICVTSDKCYLNKEWMWGYRESDELGGRDPYSASKAAAEMVFQGYMHAFFKEKEKVGIASVRAGNVIGGGDWSEDRIVPDSIKALQRSEPIYLRNPSSTRPWQHVMEPLAGYMMLAAKLYNSPKDYSGSWNFGPGKNAVNTVHDLAEKIISYWGGGEINIAGNEGGPHEARLLHLNCDKAFYVLGWQPNWDFDRTVKETTLWYKDVWQGKPALEKTRGQILSYMGGE